MAKATFSAEGRGWRDPDLTAAHRGVMAVGGHVLLVLERLSGEQRGRLEAIRAQIQALDEALYAADQALHAPDATGAGPG